MGRLKKVKENITKVQEPLFTFSLKLGKDVYTSSGTTVLEAFKALPQPKKVVTKGVLTVERNGKKFERLFMPVQMRRFLWPIAREINAKVIANVFK